MVAPYLDFLRTLGFGGLLGSAIAGLLFIAFPQFFAAYVSLQYFVMFGGFLGAATHRLIDKIILNFLNPIGVSVTYYRKMYELLLQRKHGLVSEESYLLIKANLDEQYFLGNITSIKQITQKSEINNF
jgi:hypothetical protein